MTETQKAIDESIAKLTSNNYTALLCSQVADFSCLQTIYYDINIIKYQSNICTATYAIIRT